MLRKLFRDRKGQGLVEYALLVAGIAMVGITAVSLIGHKTGDMLGTAAAILPGAHTDDNGPVTSGHLIETATDANGGIAVDVATITTNVGTARLGSNLFANSTSGEGGLIVETD